MNQLKQVNQMNQVKQENLVDLAIQAKLKFHLKNYFIQIRFIFAPFKQTPTCILFSQGKKYTEGCQTPLFKCPPTKHVYLYQSSRIFSVIQLFKCLQNKHVSIFRFSLEQLTAHLQGLCNQTRRGHISRVGSLTQVSTAHVLKNYRS